MDFQIHNEVATLQSNSTYLLGNFRPAMSATIRYNTTTHEFELIPDHGDVNPPQTITTVFNAFTSLSISFDCSNVLTGNNPTSIVVPDETYASYGINCGISNAGPQNFITQVWDNAVTAVIQCTDATGGSEVFTSSTGLNQFNHIQSLTWTAPNRLRIAHDRCFGSTIHITNSSTTPYQFRVVDLATATTDIYFLDATGSAVAGASTDMKIFFTKIGPTVFSETSWETLSHTLANFWYYVQFDRAI